MILGHLTATYALRDTFKDKVPALSPLGPLLLGALLPDLIDKPAGILFDTSGRGVAHSVMVMGVVFYFLYRLLPLHRPVILALAIGVFFHIAEDLPDMVVIFWPLLGPWPYLERQGLINTIYTYYFEFRRPVEFIMELTSYPFCAYFLLRKRNSRLVEIQAVAIDK